MRGERDSHAALFIDSLFLFCLPRGIGDADPKGMIHGTP